MWHFLNKCMIIDFLPLLFISWACLIPLVICLGGLYHICDLWGQERGVVDSVLQLLLGKMMESLNQSLKDFGNFKILLLHLTDVETESQEFSVLPEAARNW